MTDEEVTTSKGRLISLHSRADASLAEAARRLSACLVGNITERGLLLWKAEGRLAPDPFVFGTDFQGNTARFLLDYKTLIALATSKNSEAVKETARLFDDFDIDDKRTVKTKYGTLAYHRVRGCGIFRLIEPKVVKISDVRVFEVQVQYLEHLFRSRAAHHPKAAAMTSNDVGSESSLHGNSKERNDALAKLALKTFKALLKEQDYSPRCIDVIKRLEDFDDKENDVKSTIQEINYSEEVIYWEDDRGREQETTFKAFAKRMSRIRKSVDTQ